MSKIQKLMTRSQKLTRMNNDFCQAGKGFAWWRLC